MPEEADATTTFMPLDKLDMRRTQSGSSLRSCNTELPMDWIWVIATPEVDHLSDSEFWLRMLTFNDNTIYTFGPRRDESSPQRVFDFSS